MIWLLPKNIVAITLYPFHMYYNGLWDNLSNKLINHEEVHWYQQKEMLIVFFYLWYVIEWLIKFIIYGKGAYRRISFEREAYDNEHDQDYMDKRKHYAWINLL
jgi:hypothetical protein